MNRRFFVLSGLALLAGCGGGSRPYSTELVGGGGPTPTPSPSPTPTPTPPPGGAQPIAVMTSSRDGSMGFYQVRTDGSAVRLADTEADTFLLGTSVTGNKMLFRAAGDLYIANTDATGRTRLTTSGRVASGSISANGTRIAFAENTDRTGNLLLIGTGNVAQIKTMNADGTNVQTLREGVALSSPRYSPDTTRIAFNEFVGSGDSRLWTMAADGSDAKIATSHPERNFGPVPERYFTLGWNWLPTGRLIYCFVDLSGPSAAHPLETILPNATGLQTIRTGTDFIPVGRISYTGAQLLRFGPSSNRGLILEDLTTGQQSLLISDSTVTSAEFLTIGQAG